MPEFDDTGTIQTSLQSHQLYYNKSLSWTATNDDCCDIKYNGYSTRQAFLYSHLVSFARLSLARHISFLVWEFSQMELGSRPEPIFHTKCTIVGLLMPSYLGGHISPEPNIVMKTTQQG